MTTEGDGNYHLQRFLEEEGAEVAIQPLGVDLETFHPSRRNPALRQQLDLDDDTKQVIADGLSTSGEIACGGNEILEAITEILALIGASKEYQMA